jgi:DNA-binding response OmpR family regulator
MTSLHVFIRLGESFPKMAEAKPRFIKSSAGSGFFNATLTSFGAGWAAARLDGLIVVHSVRRLLNKWEISFMRVLVVEDEQLLADAIAKGLRRETMAVDVVYDGASAWEAAAVNDYDVVVLDRDLPIMTGDDVCRRIVESGVPTRILMLTAAADVGDRVAGLSLGADDYLGKPFVFAELVARVRALARRSMPAVPPVLERSGLRLDPARREVTRDGRPVALSPKEFALLEVLLRAGGTAVSTEQLLEKAWDENTDPFTNVVRVTVMTLRRRLGPPAVVVTVPGSGYRID